MVTNEQKWIIFNNAVAAILFHIIAYITWGLWGNVALIAIAVVRGDIHKRSEAFKAWQKSAGGA